MDLGLVAFRVPRSTLCGKGLPKYSRLTTCADLGHCRTFCLQQLILEPTSALWILNSYPLKQRHFKIIKVN